MASERDLELLDDYLSNRLNATEKNAFEQRMQGDPELKGEYQLQNKIAEGLRNARKAELKAMLVAIPTAGLSSGEGSQMSLPAKIGIWVAATAVVGTGLYFYLTSDQTTEHPSKNDIIEKPEQAPVETPADSQVAESTEVAPPSPEVHASTEAKKSTEITPKKSETKTKKKTDSSLVQPAGKIDITPYDPSSVEGGNGEAINQADIQTPSKSAATDMPVVNDNTSKKYRFHYQIKNGQLKLFGPFEKNLYEVMAFYDATGTKVTRFLYHESKYYLLKDDDDKIKALTPITDPKLVGKLNESRQK